MLSGVIVTRLMVAGRALLGAALATGAAAIWLAACGSGGRSPSPSPPPPPPPPPPPASCAGLGMGPAPGRAGAATAPSSTDFAGARTGRLSDPRAPEDSSGKTTGHRHDKLGDLYEELWKHRAGIKQGLIAPLRPATIEDVGEIALVRDEGDLILRANVFDLRSLSLRFAPNGAGGYDITRGDRPFDTSVGDKLTLQDDDSARVELPFSFPFYAGRHSSVFVNSDGNLTFTAGDRASTERSVSRFLMGPPRIAPLFDDLDPSVGGGVFRRAEGDAFMVTWCDVPEFGEPGQRVTVQARLAATGAIEFIYGATVNPTTAVVGVSPGETGIFEPVDLSAAGRIAGGTGAVGERFATNPELDFVALGHKFYETHADRFDQLVVWTNAATTRRAFAFEITVANEVSGIGVRTFDSSREFGSRGRLRSFVNMDRLNRYPEDPRQRFLGENNTLSLLGQEVGHRWLAFLAFRDAARTSTELLGRDQSHWSFFLDSDGSHLEGNDIEDQGTGVFRTVGAVSRYSPLDQYAMGLRAASDVPPFFFVKDPTADVTAESSPRVGVEIRGTRRDVRIEEVIAAMGPRSPDAAAASRILRQAFIYIVAQNTRESGPEIEKLERIRAAWEAFFSQSTDGRGTAEARLR